MRYATNLGKWRTLKAEETQEEKSLIAAKVKNKLETIPRVLANSYADFFTDKLIKMRNETPSNNVVAEEVFKTLVPRVKENLEIKEVTIAEIKKIIMKSKPSKSRGNDELNWLIMRQIPDFSVICVAHLINCIIRTGRIIPIHKNNKDKKKLASFCPINNLNAVERYIVKMPLRRVNDL